MADVIDWREMFAKYMDVVVEHEGTDFLDYHNRHAWTAEEEIAIQELRAEAQAVYEAGTTEGAEP